MSENGHARLWGQLVTYWSGLTFLKQGLKKSPINY